MTPQEVVAIIEYMDKVKNLTETLAELSESDKTTYLAQLQTEKTALGL